MASNHLEDIRALFEAYDSNHDNNLTLSELNTLLTDVARQITALPAVSFPFHVPIIQSLSRTRCSNTRPPKSPPNKANTWAKNSPYSQNSTRP